MAKRTGGFIGQDGINAPDPATGVTGTAGNEQVTVSWTAPSDVGGAAITGYSVVADDGSTFYAPNFSMANATYDSKSFDVSGQDALPLGLAFNAAGTKMYVSGSDADEIFQYTLSTAWDVSTASYDSVSFSVSSQDTVPRGILFNDDGTSMYICGDINAAIYQYTLSTAYDLSTASYASKSLSVSSEEPGPAGIAFNNDGTKIYVVGYSNDNVRQYTLSTAYDVSTGSYDSVTLDVSSQDSSPRSISFDSTGTRLFVNGNQTDTMYQYNLSTPYDVSSASYSNSSFSYSAEADDAGGLFFKPDGTKMYVLNFSSADEVFQYSTNGEGYPTESPVTITGLTNGTSYTFNVWAINPFGWSSPSDASAGVSPTGPRALFFGVGVGRNAAIDVFAIATTGNASDFGDLITSVQGGTACSSATRGVSAGGSTPSETQATATIEYVTIASTGSGAVFGDLTRERSAVGGASNSTRGLFFAGIDGPTRLNIIDYVTIDTLGNAVDFGDLSTAFNSCEATSSSTRAVNAGGYDGSGRNQIEYVTIASAGNSTDFGDLTTTRDSFDACSSSTRGLFGGGSGTGNIIDYITIASTGNASDFGDLTVARYDLGATSDSVKGVFGGGSQTSGGTASNVIDYVTIASTGNASDFGDLTTAGNIQGACSSAHGGLS